MHSSSDSTAVAAAASTPSIVSANAAAPASKSRKAVVSPVVRPKTKPKAGAPAPSPARKKTVPRPHAKHPPEPIAQRADPTPHTPWTIDDAAELYGVRRWSAGYFDLNDEGKVVVSIPGNNGEKVRVPLLDIVEGAQERGMCMPAMLRFSDILEAQIDVLNRAFAKAIEVTEYRNHYRGVYPIKVNQQQRVVQEITGYGRRYHYGLECGSKAELIAALAHMHDPKAYIVCNGYKDAEFIDLALHSLKMGITTILVLEMPSELNLVLQRAEALKIRPVLGVRVKLSAKSSGHWVSSGGDSSVFGLNMAQVIDIVDQLRKRDRLECLQLLHYHQGSQIPNIRTIRQAVTEATRIYVDLVKEGAAMGMLDIGGGLGIDYEGNKSSTISSCNYSIEEYSVDVIEAIMAVCDESDVAHPVILSESGRAVVAHSSVLIFNILDVNRFEPHLFSAELPEDSPELLENLLAVYHGLNENNLQESYNDAVYYRDEVRTHFSLGNLSLRERARAEQIFWHVEMQIAQAVEGRTDVPEELHHLEGALVDVYYGNFSVFQSLPDSWAINQLFPVMPIHRLDVKPNARGVIADITCDCDGRLDNFIGRRGAQTSLPMHRIETDDPEDYLLAVFLVGAYQETLGDLHNLLGDTNVVSVELRDGQIKFAKELEGDTVADVLTYVEYDPKAVMDGFRRLAEQAVQENRITARERRQIMHAFEQGLNGYTYFESHGE